MSKKKKQKTIAQTIKEHEDIKLPYEVGRFFPFQSRTISMAGDQASFGEDYGSLQELRKAIEWYVKQLDGEVNWK